MEKIFKSVKGNRNEIHNSNMKSEEIDNSLSILAANNNCGLEYLRIKNNSAPSITHLKTLIITLDKLIEIKLEF